MPPLRTTIAAPETSAFEGAVFVPFTGALRGRMAFRGRKRGKLEESSHRPSQIGLPPGPLDDVTLDEVE
jgi:hypothetical protein